MEKLILALVAVARKLRPYFQAHTIEVPTEYPMKQVLHKPKTSRRLMKWAIEMREFDIRYKPKTAIKGQVLADFVMEFTSAEPAENAQTMTDPPPPPPSPLSPHLETLCGWNLKLIRKRSRSNPNLPKE